MSRPELPSCQEPLGSVIIVRSRNEENIEDITHIVVGSDEDIFLELRSLKPTNILGWSPFFEKHRKLKWYAVDEGRGFVRLMLGDVKAFLREYELAYDSCSGNGVIQTNTSGRELEAEASPASSPPGFPANKIPVKEIEDLMMR